MNAKIPSPQTTLAILLGAHEWPYSPVFHASNAFVHSAQEFRQYLLDPSKFKLPKENLLDLFDTDKNPYDIDRHIRQFLEERISTATSLNKEIRDILVYFVGHGDFVGTSSEFYLAIRCTEVDSLRTSGLAMAAVAETITKKARGLRRVLILDCCFSAAAIKAFQAGPDQVAIDKTVEAFEVKDKKEGFPEQGTTLLCSSGAKNPSRLLQDESYTMFSKALLDVLSKGKGNNRDYLSLRDIKNLTEDTLNDLPTRDAPRPVLLSPDQSEGDVADIPFFPNPAIMSSQAALKSQIRPLRAVRVFCYYNEDDQELWKKFRSHLSGLVRLKEIVLWSWDEILAGRQFDSEITHHIEIAEVVLLLISPSFIASDACYSLTTKVLALHENQRLHAIPVLLRPFQQGDLLGNTEILPKSGVAITSWMNQDEAFADVVAEIHEVTRPLSIQRNEEQYLDMGKTFYFKYHDIYFGEGTSRKQEVQELAKELLEVCEKALSAAPSNATIYYFQGLALQALNRYEEAQEANKKAVALGYTPSGE